MSIIFHNTSIFETDCKDSLFFCAESVNGTDLTFRTSDVAPSSILSQCCGRLKIYRVSLKVSMRSKLLIPELWTFGDSWTDDSKEKELVFWCFENANEGYNMSLAGYFLSWGKIDKINVTPSLSPCKGWCSVETDSKIGVSGAPGWPVSSIMIQCTKLGEMKEAAIFICQFSRD